MRRGIPWGNITCIESQRDSLMHKPVTYFGITQCRFRLPVKDKPLNLTRPNNRYGPQKGNNSQNSPKSSTKSPCIYLSQEKYLTV
jgi:hypothetical protein